MLLVYRLLFNISMVAPLHAKLVEIDFGCHFMSWTPDCSKGLKYLGGCNNNHWVVCSSKFSIP